MRHGLLVAALLGSITVGSSVPRGARADGPGLPNVAYADAEVFKVIGKIDSALGVPRGTGTMQMHRGYLAVIFAPDSGKAGGGIAFVDIADPRAPKLVSKKYDEETYAMREAHGYGFHDDYVFVQSIYGFVVWDWSDPLAPKKVAEAKLPGVTESDYGTGAWWLAVQFPYVYLGGSGNGVYIVDVGDPTNPKMADRGGKPNPIPASQLGGFRVGPTFAIGNLLVVASMDEPGYTTLDIGDPLQPKLLRTRKVGMPNAYSSIVNGNKIYAAGNDNKIHVHDISNPGLINFIDATPVGGTDKGGYLQIQDGFAHAGMGTNYAKFDTRTKGAYTLTGTGTSGLSNRDEDFANVLGNLVITGDDHGKGSVIIPHQAGADTTPPEPNMIVPKNGATNQPLTTRIGFTFTDAIDVRTVKVGETFIVRKSGGAPLPGKLSYQLSTLNFAPDAPLELDVTYEIVLTEGGIKDLAGNALAKPFASSFSTGAGAPGCTLNVSQTGEVGKASTFAVTAPLGDGYSYTWDYGDGTPAVTTTTAQAQYAYKDPGHWTVTLAVSGKDGETTCTALQTATYPRTATAPTRASGIVLDEARKRVWVVNPDANSITAVSTESLEVDLEVSAGKHPRTLALAKDGAVWVANEDASTITVHDGGSGKLLSTIALPYASRPYGIAFSPDGGAAYVTLGAVGKLARIDPATKAVTTLDVGPTPRGLAITGDSSKILVTRFTSPLDTAEVTEVDAASFSGPRSSGAASGRLFELAYDKTPDSESGGRGVLNYLSSIAITPDGRRAFVPAKKDNVTRGMGRDDRPLTFENTVRTVLAQLDLVKGAEDPITRLDFNDRSLAFDVALTPLGDIAFVTTMGTNTVEVVDAFSGQVLTSIEKAAQAPESVLLDGSKRLWVQGFLSRDVGIYDVKGVVDFTDGQFKEVGRVSTVASEPLPAQVLLGKKIFFDASDERMSKDKYLSCATCHLDGMDDSRVWDFTDRGEGFRNTTSLLGRKGTAHGALHWSANFDEVQDFEHDMRSAFAGTGFLSEDAWKVGSRATPLGDKKAGASKELDALAAYVSSFDTFHDSPFRNADGTLGESGLAGLALFRSAGCATCHAGAPMTDSPSGKTHDVGTLKDRSGKRLGMPLTALDTPTLRSIWETPPYLHDGSAATLRDVLTSDPDGKHLGAAAKLGDDERAQLVSYLQQIDSHDDTNVDTEANKSKGCGCTTAGAQSSSLPLAALAALALRRRRRTD